MRINRILSIILIANLIIQISILYNSELFPFALVEATLLLGLLSDIVLIIIIVQALFKKWYKNFMIAIVGLLSILIFMLVFNIKIYWNSFFFRTFDIYSRQASINANAYLWNYKVVSKSPFFKQKDIVQDVYASRIYFPINDTSNKCVMRKDSTYIIVVLKNINNISRYNRSWTFENYNEMYPGEQFCYNCYKGNPPRKICLHAYRLDGYVKDSIIGEIVFEKDIQ